MKTILQSEAAVMTKFEAQEVWDSLSGAEKDVLIQLCSVKWDGYLNSKQGRSDLITRGLATKYEGYQVISYAGLAVLEQLGKLESLTNGVLPK